LDGLTHNRQRKAENSEFPLIPCTQAGAEFRRNFAEYSGFLSLAAPVFFI
jgi:hypothetical protein